MTSPSPTGPRPATTAAVLAVLAAVLIVGMKLYTGHVWEDFFITYRHSENLVAGHGLVYQPGERVHGFTSPLNVLLPALAHALQPAGDHRLPLWAYTAAAIAVLLAGLAAQVRRTLETATVNARAEVTLFIILLLLPIKVTAFTFNGQEAGFWAGFLLLAFSAVQRGVAEHWRAAGLAFAGLMWTRPDCPVHIGALGAAALAFPVGDRRATFAGLLKAAAVCTALYLPWFAWAWWYYGSPVPHTILAKLGSQGDGVSLAAWLRAWPAAASRAFEPIYAEAGGWPAWLHVVALGTGFFCSLAWLLPRLDPGARRASLVGFLSVCYLALIGASGFMFPWYFVPCAVSAALVLAPVLSRLRPRALGLLAAAPVVVALGGGTAGSLVQLRVHQRIIEDQTRTQVGLWLRDRVAPSETVFLEPIGYIGYYSGRHLLDWPGLVSPSVVAARRELGNDLWRVVDRLRPDWIVLRPIDARSFALQSGLHERYAAVAAVDNLALLQPYADLPGYGFLSSDARFTIYRRRTAEER